VQLQGFVSVFIAKVHKGFSDAFNTLKSKIDELLPEYTAKYPYAKF